MFVGLYDAFYQNKIKIYTDVKNRCSGDCTRLIEHGVCRNSSSNSEHVQVFVGLDGGSRGRAAQVVSGASDSSSWSVSILALYLSLHLAVYLFLYLSLSRQIMPLA